MTLGEKFWSVNQESFTDRMVANEKIAEDFAVDLLVGMKKRCQ